MMLGKDHRLRDIGGETLAVFRPIEEIQPVAGNQPDQRVSW
jgi:hypothetical protein